MEDGIKNILENVNARLSKKKDVGDCRLITLSSGTLVNIPVWRTGIPQLDVAIGVGGIPKGRIIEIYGLESSGKTTITLCMAGNIQSAGGKCAFVDVEQALDPSWAQKCGVDIDNLIFVQPDSGEDALTCVDELVGSVDFIVVDSVAALVPKAELEGEMGDAHMALQARMMGQAMRKLVAKAKRANTTICFINQIRKKIGVFFGDPNTTTGGNALKFYASLRMDIARIGSENNKDKKPIANKVRIKLKKNKVAPPFKEATVLQNFSTGFDLPYNLFQALLETGTITKKGITYDYDGELLGVGLETAINGFNEMFDKENMNVLYENYLIDMLGVEDKPIKKKKKKRRISDAE